MKVNKMNKSEFDYPPEHEEELGCFFGIAGVLCLIIIVVVLLYIGMIKVFG